MPTASRLVQLGQWAPPLTPPSGATQAAAVAAGWAAWRLLARAQTPDRKRRILVAEPSLTDLEEQYLIRAYRSTFISGGAGSYKDRLEKEFAAMCGCKYGVAVSNGTVAIDLLLLAAGLQPGDEVIVPSFTYVASVAAIVTAGGVPVMVDCRPDTGLIDPLAVEKAVSAKSKFLMVVHLYGYACDMDPLMDIASKHSLIVIEDAAESHGAKYKGKVVGSFGCAATFSFYANKTMTTGEGGIIVTNDELLQRRITYLRGLPKPYALRPYALRPTPSPSCEASLPPLNKTRNLTPYPLNPTPYTLLYDP
jgi:dTDP-4-amino-4,6-dideoxygalactose transaminase